MNIILGIFIAILVVLAWTVALALLSALGPLSPTLISSLATVVSLGRALNNIFNTDQLFIYLGLVIAIEIILVKFAITKSIVSVIQGSTNTAAGNATKE